MRTLTASTAARGAARRGRPDRPLARPQAAALLASRLDARSRVLVLGAGGWFGSTLLDLLAAASPSTPLLALTGRPRRLELPSGPVELGGYELERIAAFAPTLVVNCAFLTRERVAELGRSRYIAENVLISSRFLRTLELPSVEAALTVSSGAALAQETLLPPLETNPYGHLKRCEELVAERLAADRGVALVVCRAWSVSGAFVGRPHAYAFSDLLVQLGSGVVRVAAGHEVWRRYAAVDDLLALALARALDGDGGTLESGGPLVELGELATLAAAELAPGATLERAERDGLPPDRYHSDGAGYQQACAALGLRPSTLPEQLHAAARLLRPPAA